MNPTKYRFPILLLLFMISAASRVHSQVLKVPFEEVAQTADLIFLGTVDTQSVRLNEKKSMIFTDVLFKNVVVVSATNRSVQRSESVVRLTYAGGTIGDAVITVSETPRFVEGHRYLIFMVDDGQTYASPIVGGYQGLFEVVKDSRSNDEYLMTPTGKAVVGLDAAGLRASENRASSIQAGVLVPAQSQDDPLSRVNAQAPTPADGISGGHTVSRRTDLAEQPLILAAFISQLTSKTLKVTLEKRLIKQDGIGFFYFNKGGKVQAEQITTSAPPVRLISVAGEEGGQAAIGGAVPLGNRGPSAQLNSPSYPSAVAGGALGACGYHNLNLVMEQVPAGWWEFAVNNDSMYVWNQAMDIFRYVDDDGSWGDNSDNEFAAYPSSADVNNQYGFGWSPGALAMCITTAFASCGRITQSDVCWNPAYSWTNDFSVSLDGTAKLLRPINMHELGHTWGEQRGTYAETYDYDVATVMQPYYNDIIEDGWGVHANDAYLIRRIYEDQRSINTAIRDVGVESYYGSNGLNNSTTNATTYNPGQSININNVLVENMGYNAVSDLRIRFFLSTNNIISTGDYQLGSYWFWTSFCGECSNVSNYTTSIPTGVPPGTYYVGAIVSINGFGNDDLTWNNSTYLYDRINVTCTGAFSASPTSRSFASGGGFGTVAINTLASSCGWSAGTTVSWITINSGGSGTGSGTVSYTVASNTSTARTGFITFPGGSHRVDQAGGCLVTATTPISIGTPAAGSLITSDCLSRSRVLSGNTRPFADRYSFSGTAGAQIFIALGSSAFDTYVYLLGPTGTVIADDDDGGSVGGDSRIPAATGSFTLPSTGTYIIEVTSFALASTGSYNLALSAGGAGPTVSNVGVFRQGFYWLLDVDGNRQYVNPPDKAFAFGGLAGDIPITGDWNGDGHSKAGVYRPSNGLFLLDSDGNGQFTAADMILNLGVGVQTGDRPVVGDWNGDGKTKIGLFRQGFFWILDHNGNGIFEQSTDRTYAFGGTPGDVPVVGDWNGTGQSRIGLVRQGFYWILDANGNGAFDGTAAGQDLAFAFGGLAGDVPVVGDWNGDGRTKVGVFRQGFFWVLDANGNRQFDGTGPGQDLAFAFGGIAGDKPVVGKW